MSRQISLIILIPLLLVSCAYHPYHKPQVPVANQWTVSDQNVLPIDIKILPYLGWWRGFHDPVLNQLIDRGIQCNTSLNKSRGSIQAAAGELKRIRYGWIPNLDMLLGYSRNPATGFPGVVGAFIPSYMINIAHQIREQRRAKYELAAAKAEDDALKLTIISEIASAYFMYQAELERKRLIQTLVGDLTHMAQISERAYKGGLNSAIDPQELYSVANLAQGEQEVIEKNIVFSRNAIRYLLDLNPGPIHTSLNFSNLNNNQIIPGSLPMTVLENRPDMQVAEYQLRAANEGISIATSNLLPNIKLDFIGGLIAGNSAYTWPHTAFEFNDQLMTVPLIRMSVAGEISKAKGLNKVAYFNYIETLQKALRDATNALSANDRLSKRLQQTQAAQRRLAKSYELNRRLYHQGINNTLDMLRSKIALDKINIKRNQDKLQQMLTIVRLYQELAGGYKADRYSK